MASWSRNQYRGNLSELDVTGKFLHMGCAVNSLAASDAGWDLHIQVPEEAHRYAELPETWALSGRTAHVQVKYTSTDSVSVDLNTLRGWVVGSKIGVPTFLIVIFESDSDTVFRYVPPWRLNERLESKKENLGVAASVEEAPEMPDDQPVLDAETADHVRTDDRKKKSSPTRTFSIANTLEWKAKQFAQLLQLWTKHPGFMFKAKIDCWPIDGHASERAESLVAKLCWAWAWAHREPSATDDEALEKMMIIALPAAKSLHPAVEDHLPIATRLIEHVRHAQAALIEHLEKKRIAAAAEGLIMDAERYQRQIDRKPWPEVEFATTYATSTGEGRALKEGLDLAADMATYAHYLDSLVDDDV